MTKQLIFIVFSFFVYSVSFGQSDTIRIAKIEVRTYQCSNENAKTWYIHQIGNDLILANLSISVTEIRDWFEKFQNSQNIYQGFYNTTTNSKKVRFSKPNDSESALEFRVIQFNSNEIELENIPFKEKFSFKRLN